MKKIFRNKKGVSEIVGTILLLGMAIALFVIVHIVALDVIPYTPTAPSVRISGELQGGKIYLQHNGGDSLPLDTKFIFTDDTGAIIGEPYYTLNDFNKPNNFGTEWNIGEVINKTITEDKIDMVIIDVETNAIIAQDTFQEVS